MNASTLKALKASIKHWENNVAGKDVSISADDCALCRKFATATRCAGCPVYEKTGMTSCYTTPYGKARGAFMDIGPKSRQFKTAASAELNFLKSLLPKGKK